MCGENSDGSPLFGQDGRPLEPTAYRLSRLKAKLTDIRLIAPARNQRSAATLLTEDDSVNNAFAAASGKHGGFRIAGGPEIRIRALQRSREKVEAWPTIYDDRAVVICAGKVHRPQTLSL